VSERDKSKEQMFGDSESKKNNESLENEAEETAEGDAASEVETLRQQLAECQDNILRMAADFENTKKRLEREREITLKYAEETLLKELLPSLDNLERAIEQGRETDNAASLLEGVEMTWNGLLAALGKNGLKPLESIGETFDPNFHEAVAMEAREGVAANQVLKEFQKGYIYKDRLIRAAKVIVSNGGGSPS
jgi:molecular chaperone GrpE